MSVEKVVFDYTEAAEMLGISASKLAKIKKRVPRIEIDGSVGFAIEDIHAIRDMFRVLPDAVEAPADAPGALLELKPRGAGRRAG